MSGRRHRERHSYSRIKSLDTFGTEMARMIKIIRFRSPESLAWQSKQVLARQASIVNSFYFHSISYKLQIFYNNLLKSKQSFSGHNNGTIDIFNVPFATKKKEKDKVVFGYHNLRKT